MIIACSCTAISVFRNSPLLLTAANCYWITLKYSQGRRIMTCLTTASDSTRTLNLHFGKFPTTSFEAAMANIFHCDLPC